MLPAPFQKRAELQELMLRHTGNNKAGQSHAQKMSVDSTDSYQIPRAARYIAMKEVAIVMCISSVKHGSVISSKSPSEGQRALSHPNSDYAPQSRRFNCFAFIDSTWLIHTGLQQYIINQSSNYNYYNFHCNKVYNNAMLIDIAFITA